MDTTSNLKCPELVVSDPALRFEVIYRSWVMCFSSLNLECPSISSSSPEFAVLVDFLDKTELQPAQIKSLPHTGTPSDLDVLAKLVHADTLNSPVALELAEKVLKLNIKNRNKLLKEIYPYLLREILSLTYCLPNLIDDIIKPDSAVFSLYIERLPAVFEILRGAPDSIIMEVSACFAYFLETLTPIVQIIFNEPNCASFSSILATLAKEIIPFVQIRVEESIIAALPISGLISLLQSMTHGNYSDSSSSDAFFALFSLIINSQTVRSMLMLSDKGCLLDLIQFSLNFQGKDQEDMCISAVNTLITILPLPDDAGFKDQQRELLNVAIQRAAVLLPGDQSTMQLYAYKLDDQLLTAQLSESHSIQACQIIFPTKFDKAIEIPIIDLNFKTLFQTPNQASDSHGPLSFLSKAYLDFIRKSVQFDLNTADYLVHNLDPKYIWFLIYALYMDYNVSISNYLARDEPWSHLMSTEIIFAEADSENLYWSLNLAYRHLSLFPEKCKAMLARASALLRTYQPLAVSRLVHLLASNEASLCNTMVIDSIFAADCVFREVLYNTSILHFIEAHTKAIIFIDRLMKERKSNTLVFCNQNRLSIVLSYISEAGVTNLVIEWITKSLSTSKTPFLLIKNLITTLIGKSNSSASLINAIMTAMASNSVEILKCLRQEMMLSILTEIVAESKDLQVFEEYLNMLKCACDHDKSFADYLNSMSALKRLYGLVEEIDISEKGLQAAMDLITDHNNEVRVQTAIPIIHQWARKQPYKDTFIGFLQKLVDGSLINRYFISKVRYLSLLLHDHSPSSLQLAMTTGSSFFARRDLPALLSVSAESGNFEKFTEAVIEESEKPFIHINDGLGMIMKDIPFDIPFVLTAYVIPRKNATFLSLSDSGGSTISMATMNQDIICTLINEGNIQTGTLPHTKATWSKVTISIQKKSAQFQVDKSFLTMALPRTQSSVFSLHLSSVDIASLQIDSRSVSIETLAKCLHDGVAVRHTPSLSDAIATSGGASIILKRLSSTNIAQILRILASLALSRPDAFSDDRFFKALAHRLTMFDHFTKDDTEALLALFNTVKSSEMAQLVFCDFGLTTKFPGLIPRFYKDNGFFGNSALLLGGPEKLSLSFYEAVELIRLSGATTKEIEALACETSCEGLQEAAIKELISRGYQGLALAIFALGSPFRGVQLAALELASRTGKVIAAHSSCLSGDVIAAVLRNRCPSLLPILCVSNQLPETINRVREGFEKGTLTANNDIWILPLLWFAKEQSIHVWAEAITTGIFTRPEHVISDLSLLLKASVYLGFNFEEVISTIYLSIDQRDNKEMSLAFLPIISLGIQPIKVTQSSPENYIHFLTTIQQSCTFEALSPAPLMSQSLTKCAISLLTLLSSDNFIYLSTGTDWLFYVRLLSRLHSVDPSSATEFFTSFCEYAFRNPDSLEKPVQALSYLDCDPNWSNSVATLVSLVPDPQIISLTAITNETISALEESLRPVYSFIQSITVIPPLSLDLIEATKTAYRRKARLNQIAYSNLFRETDGTHRRLDLSVDGFGRHLRTKPNPHFNSSHKPLRPLTKPLLSEGIKCELITPAAIYSGKVAVLDGTVIFEALHATDHMTDARRESRKVTQISLSSLRHVLCKRYHLKDRGLELVVHPLTPYFFVFSDTSSRDAFLKLTGKVPPTNELAKLTKKWRDRKISNYEYLYWLNMYAGRSFSDPSQYPVFPWILSDYSSSILDLSNENVFRDLSLPIGALNQERLEALQTLKKDLAGSEFPSLYRMHYSNPAYVAHFLVRLLPFTSLHLGLQRGIFDAADRLFLSIGESWRSAVSPQPDFRELVPEFFTLPDFLINGDNRDLGTLRDGKTKVNDVILPPWAASPGQFIVMHRLALESDYVSMHLSNWIDLIFGYKQRGKAAEDACNDFSRSSYYECLNDPGANEDALGSAAACFGTTPDQLFKDPHPSRKTSSMYPLSSSSCRFNVLYKPTGLKLGKLVGAGFCGKKLYVLEDSGQLKVFKYERGVFTPILSLYGPDMGTKDLLAVFTAEAKVCVSSLTSDYVLIGDSEQWIETPKSAACVNCIAADGNLVAIGGEDAAVFVWNMKEKRIRHVVGHESAVTAVFVNETMDIVVSADENGVVLLTSITEGEPDKMKLTGTAKFITVTPFGLLVAVIEGDGKGSKVEVMDLGGRKLCDIDCRYDATAACLCQMPDMGEFLMVTLKNRNAMLLRIHDMAPVAVFKLESTATKLAYFNEEQIAVAYLENGDTVILEIRADG